MNAKGLTTLAGVTLVAVAATTFVLQNRSTRVVTDRRGETVFATLQAKGPDVASIELQDGDKSIVIVRKDNAFVAAGSDYPVKLDVVRDLIFTTAALRFEEAKTADPARYGDLGLGAPGAAADAGKQIIIKGSGDAMLASFLLGNRDMSVGGPQGGAYIKVGDGAQTWLVRGEVKAPGMKSDWFDNVIARIEPAKIAKVELSGGDKEPIAVSSPEAGKELELAKVPENHTVEPGKISRLSGIAETLEFQDVRKAGTGAVGARQYMAETRDGLVLKINPVGDIADNWVRIAVESKAEASSEQAKAIAAKVAGRDFRVAGYQSEVFGWTPAEMTSEQKM